MTKPMPQISVDLLKARNLLLERGWCQNIWTQRDGSICAAEAVFRTVDEELDYVALGVLANELVLQEKATPIPQNYTDMITYWNDQHGRTKQEVLDLFEAAAMRAME